MLSINGLVKIVEVNEPQRMKGDSWALNYKILSRSRNEMSGEDRFDQYLAVMYFRDTDQKDLWVPQLHVDRLVEIRWAQLEGQKLQPTGEAKGYTRVRMFPRLAHTVPK